MNSLWLILFVCSLSLLVIVIVSKKISVQWFGYLALNLVIAAFLLYFINLFGSYLEFRIPINLFTVLTVGILGIPGVLLLVALKLALPF